MLEISDKLKQHFLTDSSNKQLVIKSGEDGIRSIEDVNIFTGKNVEYGMGAGITGNYIPLDLRFQASSVSGVIEDILPCMDLSKLSEYRYVNMEIYLNCKFDIATLQKIEENLDYTRLYLSYQKHDSYSSSIDGSISCSELNTVKRFFEGDIPIVISIPTDLILNEMVSAKLIFNLIFKSRIYDGEPFSVIIGLKSISANLSNSAFLPPAKYAPSQIINGQYPKISKEITITNDDLISESFTLTESLCSEDNLKFGLCESAYCNFAFAQKDYDLRDAVVKPYLRAKSSSSHIDYSKVNFFIPWWDYGDKTINPSDRFSSNPHLIPAPYFVYDANFSTYNRELQYYYSLTSNWRLASEQFKYFYNRCKYMGVSFKVRMIINSYTDVKPYKVRFGLRACSIGSDTYSVWNWGVLNDYLVDELNDFTRVSILTNFKNIDFAKGFEIVYWYITENGTWYPANSGSVNLCIALCEGQIDLGDDFDALPYAYDPSTCYAYQGKTAEEIEKLITIEDAMIDDEIPLGVFNVTEVKKTHTYDILKKSITAYDGLVVLENNVMDWYTHYMWGMNTTKKDGKAGFEYARQIFATYFNLMCELGIDSRNNYKETTISAYSGLTTWITGQGYPYTTDTYSEATWQDPQVTNRDRIQYSKFTVEGVNPKKVYCIELTSANDFNWYYVRMQGYRSQVDEQCKGILTANILVDCKSEKGNNKILVDSGDYFVLPEGCTSFDIYVPTNNWAYTSTSGVSSGGYFSTCTIKEVDYEPELKNGFIRLLYYNYNTCEVFSCDSGVTGRDVIRSLLEVCGCFFKLDRFGRPKFIYPTKAGLYPRVDLYPYETLYPRAGVDEVVSMGKYSSFSCADYNVKDFGKIQIIKSTNSNKEESICEWEYDGDVDHKPNTYLIDDNIFYCHSEMVYDYDNMTEVALMLENMYNIISNMGYVPHETIAVGMPWLETGDRIALLTKTGGEESFIFRRTLSGIQALKDTYQAEGDEYTKEVSNFGYILYQEDK